MDDTWKQTSAWMAVLVGMFVVLLSFTGMLVFGVRAQRPGYGIVAVMLEGAITRVLFYLWRQQATPLDHSVLALCFLTFLFGSNDRVGGAQLAFQWLARGQWLISDTCPMLASALSSRVHDPKRPGDVLKVAGDPLDDVYDSARYGLYSFVTASEKPMEVRRSEVVAQFAENLHDGSLSIPERGAVTTSSLIRHLQLKAEEAAGVRQIRLGRRQW